MFKAKASIPKALALCMSASKSAELVRSDTIPILGAASVSYQKGALAKRRHFSVKRVSATPDRSTKFWCTKIVKSKSREGDVYMKWQKTNRSVARLLKPKGVALLPSPNRKTSSNATTGKRRG